MCGISRAAHGSRPHYVWFGLSAKTYGRAARAQLCNARNAYRVCITRIDAVYARLVRINAHNVLLSAFAHLYLRFVFAHINTHFAVCALSLRAPRAAPLPRICLPAHGSIFAFYFHFALLPPGTLDMTAGSPPSPCGAGTAIAGLRGSRAGLTPFSIWATANIWRFLLRVLFSGSWGQAYTIYAFCCVRQPVNSQHCSGLSCCQRRKKALVMDGCSGIREEYGCFLS